MLFRFDRLWFIFSSIANEFAKLANAKKGGSRGCLADAVQSAGANKGGAGFLLLSRAPRRLIGFRGSAACSFLLNLALWLKRHSRSGERMSISLDNVTVVSMGENVVTDVSLTVERGSINVLLGPTLAGKTTLMRLMAGLDQPTAGRILVDGKDTTGVPVRRRSVAMVYQQFMNYPSLTVYENIASPLRVARLDAKEIDRRVRRAADVLGLQSLLDRLPNQLSGGQQQRTAIARAIVKNAELVLLDEPLANLDYKLREELREELPSILRQAGSILVYATTEPLEALLLGGLTATLSQGRVVQFGPTPRVYHVPSSIDSARVFSDPPLNEITVIKQDGSLRLGQDLVVPAVGATAAIPNGVYKLGFRGDLARMAPRGQHPSVLPAASRSLRSAARKPSSTSKPALAPLCAWSAA